ncbi:DUF1540 domain-containing protein [Paenibacillus sp. FSL M8-0142]|uniref:DUF1540 domain-containing protein n=1 Tax=Paenibacillus lactis TaxID=228574 RepID=A0ABS4FFY6_9BACL|nr:hypothetical protein [Paenibacillus lactis]
MCKAEMIMIEIDRHAHMKLNEEYGAEAYTNDHQDVADKSSETCCLTFKPRA